MRDRPPAARPLGPDADGQWVRRWTSTAWNEQIDAWVRARLADQGRSIVGEPVTYRARFWSVVRCYPTGEGLVWVKETNSGHRFEAGLSAHLALIAPDEVVVPIAVDQDLNRLLTDDHGTTLDHADVADQSTLRAVVRALARLQCSLIDTLDRNDHPGLVDLPPRDAGNRVRTIAREWNALPSDHPLFAGPDVVQRIERAASVLDHDAATISDAVPLGLDINDVYAANICADRTSGNLQLRFFDFGNALWAHPFVTFHGFLDSVEEWNEAPLSEEHRSELCDDYLSRWCRDLGIDGSVLRADLVAAEVLVYVHRLISWLLLVPYADPIELRSRAEIPRKWMAKFCAAAERARIPAR